MNYESKKLNKLNVEETVANIIASRIDKTYYFIAIFTWQDCKKYVKRFECNAADERCEHDKLEQKHKHIVDVD